MDNQQEAVIQLWGKKLSTLKCHKAQILWHNKSNESIRDMETGKSELSIGQVHCNNSSNGVAEAYLKSYFMPI